MKIRSFFCQLMKEQSLSESLRDELQRRIDEAEVNLATWTVVLKQREDALKRFTGQQAIKGEGK